MAMTTRGGSSKAHKPHTNNVPKSAKENDDFIKNLPEKQEEKMRKMLANFHYLVIGDIDTNGTEKHLIEKAKGEEKSWGIPELAKYLEEKSKLTGCNLFKEARYVYENGGMYDEDMFGSLPASRGASHSFSSALLRLEKLEKKRNPDKDISLEKDGEKIERRYLADDHVSDEAKQRYLEMKAIFLGYPYDSKEAHLLASDVDYDISKYAEKATNQANGSKFQEGKAKRLEGYASAKTSEEVINILAKDGVFKPRPYSRIDIEKTSLENARDVAMSYERVLDKFPFLIGTLSGITEDEWNRDAYASCNMNWGGTVNLNASRWFFGGSPTQLKTQYEEDLKEGYHPQGTDYRSLVTHELGHALDGFLTGKGILNSGYGTPASHFSGKLKRKVMKSLGMTDQDVKKELSDYATKDQLEWFAECIAEGLHSERPRKMAAECMKQLDEILREEGLILDW